MERKIVKKLELWRSNQNKMPLVIYGARQVGKTYIALEFGKKYYNNTVYFNFEGNRDLADIFNRNMDSERIINELSAICGEKILPMETLIIFDEIQASEKALTSLKYFNENASQYHIIAAGSLLGIAVNRGNYSFPVGKVDMLTMYPLDFEEFLWATGNKDLSIRIKENYIKDEAMPLGLHEKGLELYRTYLVVGGMPSAVNEYISKNDFNYVKAIQNNILNAYIADMAKYSTPQETIKSIATFNSIPSQLAKENKKFQYSLIKSGARAKDYESSIEWMKAGGIIIKCGKINEGKIPLNVFVDLTAFKIYLSDVGLLTAKGNYPTNLLLSDSSLLNNVKGNLAENYVAQQLVSSGYITYYWESDGKAELDFVIQDNDGQIIPIETKSDDNVRSKSLALFVKKYGINYSIRISTKNFGFDNKIKSLPLYAVFCI